MTDLIGAETPLRLRVNLVFMCAEPSPWCQEGCVRAIIAPCALYGCVNLSSDLATPTCND
eukprot:3554707-Prymnesium_polylepis.1